MNSELVEKLIISTYLDPWPAPLLWWVCQIYNCLAFHSVCGKHNIPCHKLGKESDRPEVNRGTQLSTRVQT